MNENLPVIICTTLLVETSPQALPLGAACIASAIKNDSELKHKFQVQLLSFSKEDSFYKSSNAAEYIADHLLEKKNVNCISFSVYVWNRKLLEQVAELIKQRNPEILCVAGGPEVTADPSGFINFDYLCAGEGELSMPLLLNEVLVKKNENAGEKAAEGYAYGIQGIYKNELNHSEVSSSEQNSEKELNSESSLTGFKGQKTKSTFVVRSQTPDPQKLPSPWLDGTIDPSDFGGVLWELARGCPFKCSYCYESKGEKKIQYFPVERLEKELELFASKKIPQAFVLDPTYNASKKRALEMLKLIKQKAPDMFFYFEARAEFIDKELARAFASIPCSLQFGLQSADPEVLKKVNRTLDKNLFRRNIGFLNDAGAVFGFDLIYGLPGDTFSGFKNSIDWALSLYPNNLELFCLSVLPGTTLYEQGTELGLTWETETPYHVVDSVSFPKAELKKADVLAKAADYFYNRGRAVPWFNYIVQALKLKPSNFFSDFARYAEEKQLNLPEENNFQNIVETQVNFVLHVFKSRHMDKLCLIAEDLIRMNGAISEVTALGKESTVKLHYHPDDVMSEYACDLQFFSRNARQLPSLVKIFNGPKGLDWKILKK